MDFLYKEMFPDYKPPSDNRGLGSPPYKRGKKNRASARFFYVQSLN
jgi:hypothetical protein